LHCEGIVDCLPFHVDHTVLHLAPHAARLVLDLRSVVEGRPRGNAGTAAHHNAGAKTNAAADRSTDWDTQPECEERRGKTNRGARNAADTCARGTASGPKNNGAPRGYLVFLEFIPEFLGFRFCVIPEFLGFRFCVVFLCSRQRCKSSALLHHWR